MRPPCWRLRGPISVAAALLLATGCYNSYEIRPSELLRLQGLGEDTGGVELVGSMTAEDRAFARRWATRHRILVAVDGQLIEFSEDTPLTLRLSGGRVWSGGVRKVQVDGLRLIAEAPDGTLVKGSDETTQDRLTVRLADIGGGMVQVKSPGKTAGAAVGFTLAGLGVAALFTLFGLVVDNTSR
jgi:hypothetical protein